MTSNQLPFIQMNTKEHNFNMCSNTGISEVSQCCICLHKWCINFTALPGGKKKEFSHESALKIKQEKSASLMSNLQCRANCIAGTEIYTTVQETFAKYILCCFAYLIGTDFLNVYMESLSDYELFTCV